MKKVGQRSSGNIRKYVTIGYKDRHYDLKGKTVVVKLKAGNADGFPWAGMDAVVKITAEYPTYLLGIVLPHKNPKGVNTSSPYPVTIPKHRIYLKELTVREI